MVKRLGSTQPRVFTPPLRPLEPRSKATEKRTLGYACIDFAHDVVGFPLLPWQQWLLVHMLELTPAGRLRFRTVLVLVARQNGKSTISVILALFFMYMLRRKLVIGTAQDLDVAEEIWQKAVDLVQEVDEDDEPVRPDLYEEVERVIGVNGKKALVLTSKERYKVKAANRGAGRSLSADLILLDELREHRNWDAWGALTKATMARDFALTLGLSNAGDASSIVLRYLRTMAHLAIGNPDNLDISALAKPVVEELSDDEVDERIEELEEQFDDDLAVFEWSAPPGLATTDRNGWAQANPSMGYENGIAERTIASAQRTDPDHIFRTEVLCQQSDSSFEGPFPMGKWEDSTDPESRTVPESMLGYGVDVSADRSFSHISIVGPRSDESIHGEVVASRAGMEWVIPWLKERRARMLAVSMQSKGAPVSELQQACEDEGLPVVPWQGPELPEGTGALYDRICKNQMKHRPQPLLDVAAANAATKPAGDRWLWDRTRSPVDIAPLISLNAADFAFHHPPEAPRRSAYEDSDLIIA